jgi:hypothetical protein
VIGLPARRRGVLAIPDHLFAHDELLDLAGDGEGEGVDEADIWRGIFWCEMWPRQKARTSVSSILFYSGTAFLAWRDNLLVTSLRH